VRDPDVCSIEGNAGRTPPDSVGSNLNTIASAEFGNAVGIVVYHPHIGSIIEQSRWPQADFKSAACAVAQTQLSYGILTTVGYPNILTIECQSFRLLAYCNRLHQRAILREKLHH